MYPLESMKLIDRAHLDAYVMALEAWRRGITVKWFEQANHYSLSNHERMYFFKGATELKGTSTSALELRNEKLRSLNELQEKNYEVFKKESFSSSTSDEKLLHYANKISYPILFKTMYRKEVFVCENESTLKKAISRWRANSKKRCTIEQYIEGQHYRVFVMNEEVVSATKLEPISVVGNGKKTIQELIKDKNTARKLNPYFQKYTVKMNDTLTHCLQKEGYTIDDIPRDGDKVYLYGTLRDELVDSITAIQTLTSEEEKAIIEIARQLNHLSYMSIDVVLKGKKCIIKDMDATLDISVHMFPMYGDSIHLAKHLIDFYFPETKEKDMNDMLYFDYHTIRKQLYEGTVQMIELKQEPIEQFTARKYIVQGKVQKVFYRKWIQRQARKYNLHGYTRNLSNGNVEVVVGGEKDQVERFVRVCEQGSPRSSVSKVTTEKWEKLIQNGFIIKKTEIKKG